MTAIEHLTTHRYALQEALSSSLRAIKSLIGPEGLTPSPLDYSYAVDALAGIAFVSGLSDLFLDLQREATLAAAAADETDRRKHDRRIF